jgi:biopolymer transport protein ExbD
MWYSFFTPLIEMDRVNLAERPSQIVEHSSPTIKNSPISIHVREDNSILLNKKMIALDQLPAELIQFHKNFPTACPQLFHDRKANFGTYQSVKNAVETAGFTEMDVILKPA